MTDQKTNAEESCVYDVPLYKEDEKTGPAITDSKSDYEMLSMSTLNKGGIYAGTTSDITPTSKEARKPSKVTNYTRMVC
jgi:hypothetical protein